MSSTTLRITLLASEWNSSKGGLSTMNRELAIQLAKHPNVSVTFFVPKCTEDDKKEASSQNITIVEARERHGYDEPIDWLSFPPKDLEIDIIIGHGVKLGKQAQVIIDYHNCKWMQVVHTVPEELAMFKTYSEAIPKGDEKQWAEVKLCKIADLVVAVGPKLREVYSRYLSSSGKTVFNLTPGIFTELSNLKPSTEGSKKFWVLVLGRGDSEDFELKGFDIAAKAVAFLNDRSYHLIFVGAPRGNVTQVAQKLLKQGLSPSQLTVKGYLENREDLATLLSTANLAIIPSRTEGFGLTALEALSAGLPFLVSQNSGFGEALDEIPYGSSWIVDSEDPEQWAEAIKAVREKGKETALKECQELRTHYAERYSWEKQCNALVERMQTLVRVSESDVEPKVVATSQNRSQATNELKSEKKVEEEQSLASTNGEQRQAVSSESLDHLAGVLKDKLQIPQPDNASKPDGKRVENKSGQPSTLRRPLQKDQSVAEQGTADSFNSAEPRTEDRSPLQKDQSVAEQRTADRSPLQKDINQYQPKPKRNPEIRQPVSAFESKPELLSTTLRSPLQKAQSVTEPRTSDILVSPFNSADQRREARCGFNIRTSSANTVPFDSRQGARPKEVPPSSTGRKTKLKDLAILGCNVSNDSMQAARKVMQDIAPKLNLSESPPVENLPPHEVKLYLTRNKLKRCVLVVDAGMFKDAYENLPQRKVEYKELLETAADRVDKKVIILICDTCSLPPNDEVIVRETIERIVNKRQSGLTTWLKHGKLAVHPDVLVQFLISTSPAPQPNPQTILSRDFNESTRVNPVSTADWQGIQTRNPSKSETSRGCENAHTMQQPELQGAAPIRSLTGEIVLLKCMLRYGVISCQLMEDLQIWDPQFVAPEHIRTRLYEKYRYTPVAGVTIVLGVNGKLDCSVDPNLKGLSWKKGLEIAANETLMLKTRLRYGLVSFQENDVDFRNGDWEIPQHIVDSLKQEYLATPCADLCIFSDEKGQDFRCTVKKDPLRNFVKTIWQMR